MSDNQQERLATGFYIAGFVDGEGSFHIAFEKRKSVRLGWQIIPEFHLSQHKSNLALLRSIKHTLKCGTIRPNHKGSLRDKTYVLVVRKREDLTLRIVPFFERFKLRSKKSQDFAKFKQVLAYLNADCHKSKPGFRKIVGIAYSMNKKGKYRKRNVASILRDYTSNSNTKLLKI